tara:strand:- start:348 stop:827 length:480 start_codon:yes stop_codon:yes gene_type:complete
MNSKNLTKILLFFLLTLSYGCGYKVLDSYETKNFNLKEIITTGDKRVNFKIRNSLMLDTAGNKENNVIINLHTEKVKKIKEKNIKNEISKYEITLNTKLKIRIIEKDFQREIDLTSVGDYSVSDQYSSTLKNEKRLLEDLTNDISDKIQKRINLILNDF